MKKILALVLAISLIFLLAACGNKDTSSTNSDLPVSSVTDTTAFVKPQNYASVLLVTINPQFRLYLDEESNVLAVEAVNQDAETIKDSIIYENQNFEAVIKNIVATANDKGFIKEDANINFEIVEKKGETINTADILTNATAAANLAATELEITIKVDTIDITTPDTPLENDNASSEQTTSSNTESNSSTTPSTPTESKPVHTHTFSNATCIEAKKCSCGATQGNALGHDYKNGVCSRCSEKDPNYVVSYTAITQKSGYWSLMYVIDDTLYRVSLTLCDSDSGYSVGLGLGDPFGNLPEDFQQEIREQDDGSYVVFNGGEYYMGRGDGDELVSVTENGNAVTITDSSGNSLVLTRTAENTLTVTSSPAQFSVVDKVPTGATLTFIAE